MAGFFFDLQFAPLLFLGEGGPQELRDGWSSLHCSFFITTTPKHYTQGCNAFSPPKNRRGAKTCFVYLPVVGVACPDFSWVTNSYRISCYINPQKLFLINIYNYIFTPSQIFIWDGNCS